ncbi:MAG: hypothetical protein AB1782_06805 [Cyanobacteriota bacterium]
MLDKIKDFFFGREIFNLGVISEKFLLLTSMTYSAKIIYKGSNYFISISQKAYSLFGFSYSNFKFRIQDPKSFSLLLNKTIETIEKHKTAEVKSYYKSSSLLDRIFTGKIVNDFGYFTDYPQTGKIIISERNGEIKLYFIAISCCYVQYFPVNYDGLIRIIKAFESLS